MNKRLLVFLLLSLFIPILANAQAQTTSVSISVADSPDGQAWANGSFTSSLVIPPGNSSGTSSPGPSGTLDASGNATFSLTSTNDITYPGGSVWQVFVCPQIGCAVASFQFPLFSPQVIGPTASYIIAPPSFRIVANQKAGTIAYRDSEVVSNTLGSAYFNVTSSQLKFCAGLPCSSNWTADSGGSPDWGSIAAGTNTKAGTFTQSGNAWDFSLATGLKIPTSAGAAPTASGSIAYDLTNNQYEAGVNGTNFIIPTTQSGVTGEPVAFTSSNSLDNIPLYISVDAVQGGGIGQASTPWVTATTYPLCQEVSNSGNFLAVSSSNGATTPGMNSHIWYPVPNASRPTQFDCAFYIAQSLVTSTLGVELRLGIGSYNAAIGMTYPTVSSAGNPGVSIKGAGVGQSVINLTGNLLSGSGGDGLAMLNVPVASTSFALPRYEFSGFTLEANALASSVFDLHACQQCVVRDIDLRDPAFGSDHAFECGTIGGGSTGWCFELTMENVVANYNPSIVGHFHGNGAATFSTSVSGGVPTITVTNGGAQYDTTQLTGRLVKAGGVEACSSIGTFTFTLGGSGNITGVTTTSTGCAASGTVLQIYPQLQVSYGFKFSNMSDSHFISSLVPGGIGSVCGIYSNNVNAMNKYFGLHPINTFDGVCANGTETFSGTQIDSVYNHGINVGSGFQTENFYDTMFEWNGNNYQGSSDWYFATAANPPINSPSAVNIYGDQCGNTPHQSDYAHIVNGVQGTSVDAGGTLPPRVNFYQTMYCSQFATSTQSNFTNIAANIGWGNGTFTNLWTWNLGTNATTVMTLGNALGTATSPSSLFHDSTVAATSGQNVNASLVGAHGAYWNSSATAPYGWEIAGTFASGSNPLATFAFKGAGTAPSAGDLWTFDGPVVVGSAAGATTTVAGSLFYDTTNKNLHVGANGVDNINVLVPSSLSLVNNDCVTWSVAANVVTLGDLGTTCGGAASAFSALTGGTNTGAAMVVGTGASLSATGTGTIAATSLVGGMNCGVAGSLGCVITGGGSSSGIATITWPTAAGTAANAITFSNAISSSNAITASVGFNADTNHAYTWISRSQMSSTADGVINLKNNAGTGFSRITFGSDTSSFPAICGSGTTLLFGVGSANCTTLTTVSAAAFQGPSTGAEVVASSATPTFALTTSVSRTVLTANITSFTLGSGADGQTKTLCFKQGAGPFTVAAPGNVHGFFTVGTNNAGWNCQSFVYDTTDAIWLATTTGVINE